MALSPVDRTVLVLRGLGLGDALTAVPALRGLRRAYPRARLVLAGPLAIGEWLRELGVVDEAVGTSGPRLRWSGPPPDLAVNLHGRGPESHQALTALAPGRLLAFACAEAGHLAGPAWPSSLHEVDRWCTLVRSDGGECGPEDLRLPAPPRQEHIVIHPGAASGSRRWPAERWGSLAGHLARRGHKVVVTGSAAESRLCATVARGRPGIQNTCGELDLPALSEVVGAARLLVCGDTGVAHLATATSTPSVRLFGPVPPQAWGPRIDHDRHVVLWRPVAGDPVGNPHGAVIDPRLARIQLDDVIGAVDHVLSLPAVT